VAEHGYLSEESKHRFTLVAGLLGAGFFLAQMTLPFVVMFLIVFPAMSTQAVTTHDIDRAALWNDELWLVEQTRRLNWRDPETARNAFALGRLRLSDLSEAGPAIPLEVPGADPNPALVLTDERLWVIGEDLASYYEQGSLTRVGVAGGPERASVPFALEGRPAVLSLGKTTQLLTLVAEDGGARWHARDLSLGLPPDAGSLRSLQATEVGSRLFLFAELCTESPQRCAILTRALDEGAWSVLVANTCSCASWNPVRLGSEPAVYMSERKEGGGSLHRLVRLAADGPQNETIEIDAGKRTFERWRAFARGKRLLLVAQPMPGGLKLIEVEDARVVRTARRAGSFPFMPGVMTLVLAANMLPAVLSLLLALLLTVQMRRHRIQTYTVGEERRTFATLWQRALAQLVDLVPLGAGFALPVVFMWRLFEDPERLVEEGPFFPLIFFAPLAAALLWGLLVILVFSYLEGRFGKTPGKWLLHIRVLGTDLQPCGFGRAFVRNLLTFVDGFFNFLVGALLVALTESWQRLGDLAARTVVVADEKSSA
jgi:uncharacterized RDD family membrane protein YckC